MSDALIPVHRIKAEPNATEDDIEAKLPAYTVIAERKLLQSSVEVIDLTEDEFLNEFKSFLHTVPDLRRDVDARKAGTQAKARSIQYILPVPALLLDQVHVHQDTFVCELLRINFTNTMLYGKLITQTFRDGLTVYQLDDGSERVDVYYRPSNNKMLDILNKLFCCDDSLRRKPTPLNEEAIPSSLELRHHLKLLISIAKTRCQSYLAPLTLRTQCFVIGRLFVGFGGKISVFAQTILPDNQPGPQSCELFWKCHLLAVYEPVLEMFENRDDVNETASTCMDKLIEKMSKLFI